MPGNSFGQLFRLTTFGESHGPAIGGVIDGCPSGLYIDTRSIQVELDRRKPSQYEGSSPRLENDKIEILSGLYENITTGAPIAFIIRNEDERSADYDHVKDIYRASHGDLSWTLKYGTTDYRGGGRLSGRETACRVAGGAIAKKLLENIGTQVVAYSSQIGNIAILENIVHADRQEIEKSSVRCPFLEYSKLMIAEIAEAKHTGDTLGGAVTCLIEGCPPGLGEPVFDKLQADLAKAVMSIGTVKAVEFGLGTSVRSMRGSEYIDPYVVKDGKIVTIHNHSAGIQGGISTGESINFKVSFSPVPSIAHQQQQTIDKNGNVVVYETKGRHDICIIPRIVPVVEAMAAMVVADHYLRMRAIKL